MIEQSLTEIFLNEEYVNGKYKMPPDVFAAFFDLIEYINSPNPYIDFKNLFEKKCKDYIPSEVGEVYRSLNKSTLKKIKNKYYYTAEISAWTTEKSVAEKFDPDQKENNVVIKYTPKKNQILLKILDVDLSVTKDKSYIKALMTSQRKENHNMKFYGFKDFNFKEEIQEEAEVILRNLNNIQIEIIQ